MPLPSAVTGGDFCGVVEKVRRLGEHQMIPVTCLAPSLRGAKR
jgi:hypothetical protein